MILPLTKGSLSLALLRTLLFCSIVLFKLLIYAKETLSYFLRLLKRPIFHISNTVTRLILNI